MKICKENIIAYVKKSFFKFFHFFSNKKAFTITEMLIVTMIMGVLFSAGIKTYIEERNRHEFNNSMVKIISIFKFSNSFI